MIYNLVLFSAHHGELETERGFDKRPLRFTHKGFAEREAHEKNMLLLQEYGQDCPLIWKVVVEKND